MDDAEEDLCDGGGEGNPSTSGGSSYRLFGRQTTVHQMMGGGRGILRCSTCFRCIYAY